MTVNPADLKENANKVEFIKRNANEILIRTHRKNGEVVERVAIVMPPDEPKVPATKVADAPS